MTTVAVLLAAFESFVAVPTVTVSVTVSPFAPVAV
jgi:hypothetical protein